MDVTGAISAVRGTIERALDKNLQDMVRTLRNRKDDEAKCILDCMNEIKAELKTDSLAVKANAVNKLVYLQMLGCDINWAAFNVIEVMSSSKFVHKRIGYLAASQIFHDDTEVLMLATNMIKKDLNSKNVYDTGVAISGLSCFMTEDMARDLYADILTLMASSKPYLRKKAVLLIYKVFLRYPDALRICFPRLREKLDDPDPGVQAAAVNVICELARKNPQNYLSLAPVFFQLMNSSTNNWILIKIIKLFGALTPLEPRLGKKLIGPLTNLIHSTSAMSLLYECINTVLAVLISISSGIPDHQASIQLCVQKLCVLIEDSDQNLKYLGLLAMTKVLKHHPKSVQSHKDLVLNCLDDRDESIRLRALDLLLHGMTNRSNLQDIIATLLRHASSPSCGTHYKGELVQKIVQICSQSDYEFVTSFEWYISVLVQLAQISDLRSGELIAAQLLDVAIRVDAVRRFCAEQMALLLENCHALPKQNAIFEVVHGAAWICSEYAQFLKEPRVTLEAMLTVAGLSELSGQAQSMLLLNACKLYCKLFCATAQRFRQAAEHAGERQVVEASLLGELLEVTGFLVDKFALFVHSADLEVQERAVSVHQLLNLVARQLTKLSNQQTAPVERPSTQAAPHSLLLQMPQGDAGEQPTGASSSTSSISQAKETHEVTLEHHGQEEAEEEKPEEKAERPNRQEKPMKKPVEVFEALRPIELELSILFGGELNPVAAKAQRKVPIPEGLDLDQWINEPPPPPTHSVVFPAATLPFAEDEPRKKRKHKKYQQNGNSDGTGIFADLVESSPNRRVELTKEQREEIRQQRLVERETNPHYLKPARPPTSAQPPAAYQIAMPDLQQDVICFDDPEPAPQPQVEDIFARPEQFAQPNAAGARPRSKKSKAITEEAPAAPVVSAPRVKKTFDAPEGAVEEESDENARDPNDPHSRLNIALDDLFMKERASGKTKQQRKPRVGGKRALEPTGLSADEFTELLASGGLTCRSSAKVRCRPAKELVEQVPGESDQLAALFRQLAARLEAEVGCSMVETVGVTASFHGLGRSAQSVCLLLKLNVGTGSVSLDLKAADQALLAEVMEATKTTVKSFTVSAAP